MQPRRRPVDEWATARLSRGGVESRRGMKRLILKIPPALVAIGALVVLAATMAAGAGADPGTGGAFVIGDGNAAFGSQVTFWGAQWWKDNTVSGGQAPPSFKGYAVNVDAVDCT